MPIFRIYVLATASKLVGEVEAETMEEAVEKAEADPEIAKDAHMSICHHCASEIDLGDIYEYQAEEDSAK